MEGVEPGNGKDDQWPGGLCTNVSLIPESVGSSRSECSKQAWQW